MKRKKILRLLLVSLGIFLLFGLFCFVFVEKKAEDYVTFNAYQLPGCKTAVLLGTSKWLKSGSENPYFTNRINAAAGLYHRKVVSKIILSGDNRRVDYNEPKMMMKNLVKLGLPESALVQDFAGIRTFDSMIRADKVFGQDTVIVVSQRFHTIRAVFIARACGITAFGYNAESVRNAGSIRITIREFFSRIRCVLDVYVLHSQPRHLGEKIMID